MTENAENMTVTEPRKLGLVGRVLVALMVVVTLAFAVGASLVIRAKKIEKERKDQTSILMTRFLAVVGHHPGNSTFSPPPRPFAGTDPTGQRAIASRFGDFGYRNSHVPPTETDPRSDAPWDAFRAEIREGKARDAWGNPYLYRCPGPIHKNGWDLISCGPNGAYEEGGGDDMVVGEDTPLVVTEEQWDQELSDRRAFEERTRSPSERMSETRLWLEKAALKVHGYGSSGVLPSRGGTEDPTGQAVLRRVFRTEDTRIMRDGWDRPIYYRCPGPVHKNGWDLISGGPNGIYEEGGGDDIVVGEDVPGGIAAIESGAR